MAQIGGTPNLSNMNVIEKIASNKYFIGFAMISMNIGARFLIEELTPEQKKWVNTQSFRRFIVFCIASSILFSIFILNNAVFETLISG